MDPTIVFFGLGVGVLVGMTGIGGGSLMTPLLILVMGVKPVVAIGTDMAYGAITKCVGAWKHWKLGNVDWRLSGWLGAGSLPGSLLGVGMIDWMHRVGPADCDRALLTALGSTLLLVSMSLLGRTLWSTGGVEEVHEVVMNRATRFFAATTGFAVGVVLGLTSVGSGALIGLALIAVFRLSPRRVVGTDVFHAAILLWVTAAAHISLGNVDFHLMTNILIGSVPGVWLGSGVTHRLPAAGLRLAIACVLMASGLGILAKGGLAISGPILLGVPCGVGVVVTCIQQRRGTGSDKSAISPGDAGDTASWPDDD